MGLADLLDINSLGGKDLLRLLVGREIGVGAFRNVYTLQGRPDVVLKIEMGSYDFCNIREFDLWEAAIDAGQSHWLAPVLGLSPSGTCLLMARTQPVNKLPQFIPEWLTDTKPENWGLYEGRVVCHDYGSHLALERGITKKVKRVS